MSRQKKFITTQDKSVCDMLLASGFNLLSECCGVYTFINDPEKGFNFSSINSAQFCFTDKLTF